MAITTLGDALANLPVRHLLGVPIHAVTFQEAVDLCGLAASSRQPLVVGVVNVAKLVLMRRDPVLRDSVIGAQLILADGMGVVWASRLLGDPIPERIAGIDLFEALLGFAASHGFSVYLLGARGDVLADAIERARERFPELLIAGSRDGYFSDAEAPEVAAAISRARPDFLFVAISSPKKEVFLARYGAMMGVPVLHGVGGSFDVMGGRVRRAPRAWQQLGVEWLYRVFQEPARMWRRYLMTNTVFLGLLVREVVRRRVLQSLRNEERSGLRTSDRRRQRSP
jgi:N-acetylglucosaminyldiphosphoundecaprenol N-acetyl-beta-D-mannosaminyltransferase